MNTELFRTLDQIQEKESEGESSHDHLELLITLKGQLKELRESNMVDAAWIDNHEQYPRLLAAISKHAGLTNEQFEEIGQSTELETCEVHALFICAEKEVSKE